MSDAAQRWNTWASISTVAAAAVAAAAFVWSARTDLEAARAQSLASALQIVQAQTQLAVEHPDLVYRDPGDPKAMADPSYVWFAVNALLTADALYTLEGDDPTWRAASAALVRQHLPFVLSSGFPCDQYSPAFLAFVREQAPEAATARNVTICAGV